MTSQQPRTIVAFHAHPDDEALLTAGTMAALAAAGHRVVLVLATDGGLGLASATFTADSGGLGEVRLREARAAAEALGVARVEWLGYADSGSGPVLEPNPVGQVRFARARLEEAAERLAGILRTERADVLLSYDRNGGYGHRDHVRVHEVGRRAVEIARTPRLLEATIPRDTLVWAIRVLTKVYPFPPEFDARAFERSYSPRAEITHRVDVRAHLRAKRAAMRAHASQASGGTGDRTLAAFLKIPRPLFTLVFGREWFHDPFAPADAPVQGDILDGLP
ncbi:MAG: PIG-L family deacetylase [Actinobacteria bacterium]|nr:PIG-L family deacetylase [Actinomycetota bacterium]